MSLWRVATAAGTACLLALGGGCSLLEQDSPDDDAAALAEALTIGDLSGIAVAEGTSARAQKWWNRIREGMGESSHEVRVEEVREGEDDTAAAELTHVWRLDGSKVEWTYRTQATLVLRDDAWAVDLSPGAVVAGLRSDERLDLTKLAADRADIVGADGKRLVTDRPVLIFGIDKTLGQPNQHEESARELARLLDVDADELAKRVQAAPAKAFVEALVLREQDVTEQIRQGYTAIPSARALEDQIPLAPTREFARAVLGTVGPVTAEMVEKSKGRYAAGDVAGLSGLQARYDDRLGGRPGWLVQAVGDRDDKRELFRAEPEAGEPLRITLDQDLQTEAERILSQVRPASAIVAVRPSTGEILAAANGSGSEGYATATVGQYAPGSTFKVVSSLALLRAGLSSQDTVPCPPTTVVDGKEFGNYSDYPSSSLGRISLSEAVAQSCNTAFILQRGRVSPEELVDAAEALGLGKDYDVGVPAYFGSVPGKGSETGHAASLIGQGQVLASPVAMAAVVSSVVAGRTVVPRLVAGVEAEPSPAEPLTRSEAEQLADLMAGVVERGSGRFLSDVGGGQVIAKTGTAEFGEAEPPETHAWMIAGQADLAVAVFVDVGESGSKTAGPLLEEFLRATRP